MRGERRGPVLPYQVGFPGHGSGRQTKPDRDHWGCTKVRSRGYRQRYMLLIQVTKWRCCERIKQSGGEGKGLLNLNQEGLLGNKIIVDKY